MNEPVAIGNIVVIALTGLISYLGFTNTSIIKQYLFSTRSILQGREYYRLLSSGVLHADWVHLIFNMYSLYSFGGAVEIYFGPGTFLSIYLAGIVGGNLLALLLHRKEDYYALGASGGVCGVIFACIFLLPVSSVQLFFIPIPIPAYIYAIGFMLFSYYGVHAKLGNIGHDAHLGGSIIGLITATIIRPHIVPDNPVLYPVVMLLAVALLVLLYLKPFGHHSPRRFTRNNQEDDYPSNGQ